MAKIISLRNAATPILLQRQAALNESMRVPPAYLRASYVKQFVTCGKKNCRCRRGDKHGPFHYLVQCMGVGVVRKFLLKTPAQRKQARAGITAHAAMQSRLEQLSQLNTELLRRGELLSEFPS